jgi:hypothetical protein
MFIGRPGIVAVKDVHFSLPNVETFVEKAADEERKGRNENQFIR